MLFDTHIHTTYSTDSNMNIETAITRATALGRGITITEHMDLAYPEPEAFVFDVKAYLAEYAKYRNDQVLLGIEVGMRPDCLEENRRIVKEHAFDYVIGSIHVVDNVDIYHSSFYDTRPKREVYNRYFDAMLLCLKNYDFIDSLGHIDYIARYAQYSDPDIHYHEFADRIDEVVKAVAERGKALEINTRRLTNKAAVEQLLPIYKRFAEVGGKLVTIGSDAHKPEEIGRGLAVAQEMAEACRLKVVYFKQRKPEGGRA